MSRIEVIGDATLYLGDCREILPTLAAESVDCCITSPPYFGLRDYGVAGQLGLEPTPAEFVEVLVEVFREVRRVLRDDGTVWLNLGDSYAGSGKGGNPDAGKQATNKGSQTVGVLYGKTGDTARQAAVTNITRKTHEIGMKPKDLIGIPWRVAFALQADGWYLRSDIIWHKPNPMPESVTDRPTKAHEYLFLLAKSERYYYDAAAISEEATCDDPRLVDGFVPKSVNGKHRGDPQSAEFRTGPRFGGHKHGDSDDPAHATKSGNVYVASGRRNKRTVWTVPTSPFKGAHFATFPPALIEPCILAGCPTGGTILDPFGGSGTVGAVAAEHGRKSILCELNPDYLAMQSERIRAAYAQQRLFA